MKKKIFSILLSLCMVLTMMPVATGTVWAEDESPTEEVKFDYAYDVQRSPAFPDNVDAEIGMYDFKAPLNGGDKNAGDWKLSKVGTYSFLESQSNNYTELNSENLRKIVEAVCKKYDKLKRDAIVIHELKDDGKHIAYGVVIAYDAANGKAAFIGDTWQNGGACYLLSKKEIANDSKYTYSNPFKMNAGKIATGFVQNISSISLGTTGTHTFSEATVDYEAQTPLEVTVTNSGNVATGNLNVALSGANASSFTLSKNEINDIEVKGNDTFTVTPNNGLVAGTYMATVTVSGKNIVSQSFNVSFTVKAVTVTISGDTTYTGNQIRPDVTVNVGENTLTENTDYTVTYGENINAGKGTVTIKEKTGSSYDFGEVNKEFTITQREVNISGITADNKVYDGNTNATITSNGTLEGKIENDDILYSVTGTFENKDAGEDKTVNLAISLTGDKAGNYKLAEKSQKTATANITAREITLTGGISAVNRAYEANNTEVTLTKETLSFNNLVNGEVLDINIPAKGTIGTPDAGENKAVTYSGVTLADVEGKDLAKNYKLSNQLPAVKVNIAKATATITVNDKTAYIGDKAPDLSKPEADKDYTVSGLLGEDKLTTVPTLAYESTLDMTKTNEYTINASGASAGDNYTITYVPGKLTVSNRPSDGGSHSSSIQKPTIIAGEGAETSLSILGTNLTIKMTEGYELTDVILNGVSKGKVTELTGLRTGDKVEVKTEKKQEKPSKEEIIAALDSSKLVARSKLITLENGKKAVRVTWYDQNGNEINFDGIEVYRSVKRYKGYGLEPFYTTKGDKSEGYYVNTKDLKEGTTYYYKVRGYVTIDGQKYYTDYSLKAIRTIK